MSHIVIVFQDALASLLNLGGRHQTPAPVVQQHIGHSTWPRLIEGDRGSCIGQSLSRTSAVIGKIMWSTSLHQCRPNSLHEEEAPNLSPGLMHMVANNFHDMYIYSKVTMICTYIPRLPQLQGYHKSKVITNPRLLPFQGCHSSKVTATPRLPFPGYHNSQITSIPLR